MSCTHRSHHIAWQKRERFTMHSLYGGSWWYTRRITCCDYRFVHGSERTLRGDTGRITGVCSDQMMLKSIAGSGAARGNLDLTVNGGEMPTDGAGTDHQLFCYLGIGKSLCHQAQYLDLSCRQAAGIGG